MSIPLFGVVGWKNTGKTTLVAKLIEEFTRRGARVAAVKHAHHSFDVDHEGRDSWRFREAGAVRVAVSSPVRWAIMAELRDEPEAALPDLLRHIEGVDLILVEGFKRDPYPKLELRSVNPDRPSRPLAPEDPSIIAVAADGMLDAGPLPFFLRDDVGAIADMIADHLSLLWRAR